MKRGFTLIEMMIALSISAVMLSAIVGLLSSVWMMAKESANELQGALRARSIREQLFYNLSDNSGKALGFGLSSSSKILIGNSTIEVESGDKTCTLDLSKPAVKQRYCIDEDRIAKYYSKSDEENSLQCLFLKVEYGTDPKKSGYAAYYDRLVVPVFGKHPEYSELENRFGL